MRIVRILRNLTFLSVFLFLYAFFAIFSHFQPFCFSFRPPFGTHAPLAYMAISMYGVFRLASVYSSFSVRLQSVLSPFAG